MKITVHPIKDSERKPHVTDNKKLGFCKHFTDLMFVMQYSEVDGWHNAEIKKLQPFQLEASCLVLHYAQEIFEGLKAYRTSDDHIQLFRPDMNAKRFNRSAARLCMPSVPENVFIESIEALIRQEHPWVPRGRGAALYIRPFMFAADTTLGVRASSEYIFSVILSPVGPYYQEGFNPVSLFVTDELVRAAKGGLGEAKTGANYAASLLAGRVAREKGCAQVLWLDAAEHRFIEEVGAMNIFFVIDGKVVTPKLNGSILPGVTRDSVLQIARHMGLKTEERTVSIDEVIGGITTGSISEIFGSGTAASISPVGSLKYKDRDYVVSNRKVGPISQKLYDTLMSIQYGDIEDPFKWIHPIELSQEKAASAAV